MNYAEVELRGEDKLQFKTQEARDTFKLVAERGVQLACLAAFDAAMAVESKLMFEKYKIPDEVNDANT